MWDCEDYIVETERELGDVPFINKLSENPKNNGEITEEKYFTIDFKKATNLDELYLLNTIHKRLSEVLGRPVISNCGTPTENVSEFLDSELISVLQKGWSYIKDAGDFIKRLKNIDHIPQDAIMVTADYVGLYPSLSHNAGLEALRKAFHNRENEKISTDGLAKMAELVLKNNYFELNGKVKKQISGTAIGTKFAPQYVHIFFGPS